MLLTVVQTHLFQLAAADIWTPDDLDDLVDWMAAHSPDGDVIPQSGGLRKIRWQVRGRGKRGGARLVYYTIKANGEIWLLMAYTKAKFDNLPLPFLKELKNAVQTAKK